VTDVAIVGHLSVHRQNVEWQCSYDLGEPQSIPESISPLFSGTDPMILRKCKSFDKSSNLSRYKVGDKLEHGLEMTPESLWNIPGTPPSRIFELANLRITEVYLLYNIILISKDRSVKPTASEPPRLRSVNEQRVRDAEVVRLFSCGILPFDESDLCPWTRATLSRSSVAEKQCYRGKFSRSCYGSGSSCEGLAR
jgi:hypothetical protein